MMRAGGQQVQSETIYFGKLRKTISQFLLENGR